MIISVHIADIGVRKSMAAYRAKPRPQAVDGLRFSESWLVSPLRTGLLPKPEVSGVALVAVWNDDDALERFLGHPLAGPYRDGWQARFEPIRTAGAWPGLPDLPRREQPTGDDEPVAVLTMARARLTRTRAFLVAAAEAERNAVHHPAFIEGASFVRAPNLVATFTLWRNVREMRQYTVGAYPGGHVRAMQAHEERVFHHETIFVRLRPYMVEGRWNGRNPLELPAPVAHDLSPARNA